MNVLGKLLVKCTIRDRAEVNRGVAPGWVDLGGGMAARRDAANGLVFRRGERGQEHPVTFANAGRFFGGVVE